MRTTSPLLFLALVATSAVAQPACPEPEARAFDFWLGHWAIEQQILQADGSWLTLPARTSVAPALGGCALVEHWEGEVQFFWEGMATPEPMEGLSVRAYDPDIDQWRIWWMDTRTPTFDGGFTGGFEGGRGTFFQERETPEGPRTVRITFSDITPASVRWDLASSSDAGQTWTTLWVMTMRRGAP